MTDFDPSDRADTRQYSDRLAQDRIRFMARASGYVMARKPGRVPFVLSEKEWASLPLWRKP